MKIQSNKNGVNVDIGNGFYAWSLFLVFLVGKLFGFINWSWWWISAPIWVPILLATTILLLLGVGAAVENVWGRF